MQQLIHHLRDLYPLLSEVFRISGSAGASLGVLHHGEAIYTANFGFRDVEHKIVADENTLYYVASLSKAVTAAGLGLLVDEGKIRWDDIVSEILPEFHHPNDEIRKQATLVDILSHRTGLASKMSVWMGDHSRMLVEPSDFIKTTTTLEPTAEIGASFLPNNWLYGIAAEILERYGQQSFGSFIENKLFKPLSLPRMRVRRIDNDDNYAKAYMYDADAPFNVLRPPIEVGACMEGAVGIKASVADLLTFYATLMRAGTDQHVKNRTFTPGLPFRQVQELFRPRIGMKNLPQGFAETAYSLGWAQTRLPSALGGLSDNLFQVEQMPVIGEGQDATPHVLYHEGSLLGYTSTVLLFPETESAIVVLANTLANQDFTDWATQILTEGLFHFPSKHDFVSLAKEAASNYSNGFPKMHNQLEKDRIPGTTMKPAQSYVGRYFNSVGTFYLEIFEEESSLYLAFAGRREDKHRLAHYHHNTLSWEMTYADCKRFETWPVTDGNLYLLEFQGEENELMQKILWRHDPDVPEGEIYVRKEASLSFGSFEPPQILL